MLRLLNPSMLMLGLMLLGLPWAASAARLALVIGNDSYVNVRPLSNAVRDGEAVAGSLRQFGYTVILKTNANRAAMEDELLELKARLRGGDEVVAFFSGHGTQFDALNYLLPVDVCHENEDG